MRRIRSIVWAASAIAIVGVVGCEQQPKPGVYASPDPMPDPAVEGRPRSLALDSRRLLREAPAGEATLAWYVDRNDARATVYDGVASPTLESVSTITYDREHSSFGRVHEHFSETRYRSRYREVVR